MLFVTGILHQLVLFGPVAGGKFHEDHCKLPHSLINNHLGELLFADMCLSQLQQAKKTGESRVQVFGGTWHGFLVKRKMGTRR